MCPALNSCSDAGPEESATSTFVKIVQKIGHRCPRTNPFTASAGWQKACGDERLDPLWELSSGILATSEVLGIYQLLLELAVRRTPGTCGQTKRGEALARRKWYAAKIIKLMRR
ncbi:hypothetical protein SCLCIDRAFT_1224932 [Scleroderma citrinum Foug A]|uniref:Uncharacterized protein n=1 Tax=Scleroderma citrinum Foug A TaxID=1036808 RepID=A0A0C3CQZ4_9AGAM|nr:hypothetical protein SCLCIDRAFT_1224932 [Scleroderma citrinum Foug A]